MAESEGHAVGPQSLLSDSGLKAEVKAWTDSHSAKTSASKRCWGGDKAHRVEILVGARDDQLRKNEDQESAWRVQHCRYLTKEKAKHEIQTLIRVRLRMTIVDQAGKRQHGDQISAACPGRQSNTADWQPQCGSGSIVGSA